ncbi:pre-peptidase C-terminal domain-containing protein, partial [Bradyrhizobium sp. GCM10023182]
MSDTLLDTTATIGVLTVGGATTGTIDAVPMSGSANTSFDHDWYKVTLTAGHSYSFSAQGTSGTLNDVAIDLRDTGGSNLVTSVIDGGVNGTARFNYTPSLSGTYYFAISAGGSNPASLTGNDSISVTDNGTPSTDTLLDTIATIGVLTVGGTTTGAIDAVPMSGSANTSFDHDWYKVTLTAGHSYSFSAQGTSGTLNDVAIDLRDTTGNNLVTSVVDGGANHAASVSYTPTSSGTYYLAISAGGSNPASLTGNDSISVTDNGAPSTDTLLDTTATIGVLTVGGTTTGAIDAAPMSGSANTSFDHDWYKVNLTDGHRYSFSAQGTSGSLNDVAIDLRDTTGNNLVTSVVDGGANHAASFSYTPTSSGTYYFAISAGGSNPTSLTGNDSISVTDNGIITGSNQVVAGFDWSHYPGQEAMAWLFANTNLREVGYYLGKKIDSTDLPGIIAEGQTQHGSNVSNTNDFSWMGTHDALVAQGWKIAPIFVGQQDPTYVTNNGLSLYDVPTQAMGTIDGDEAAKLLTGQGFQGNSNTVVYLDWENGGSISSDEAQYFVAWSAEISAAGYLPGIYSPYSAAPSIQSALTQAGYSALFWAANVNDDLAHPSNYQPSGNTFLTSDPTTGSAFSDATGWQYRGPSGTTYNLFNLGSQISSALNDAGIFTNANVDLDTFKTLTASAQPDLSEYVAVAPTTAAAGSSMTVDAYAMDIGKGPSGASTAGIYLSSDATITTSDTLLTTVSSGALTSVGQTGYYDHQTLSVMLSGNLTPGTYY